MFPDQRLVWHIVCCNAIGMSQVESNERRPGMSIAQIQLQSDRVINENVSRSIRELSYRQIHEIECVSREGVVTLCGTLASFYLKQVAQSIASKVPGVNRVVNDIQVIG